MNSGRSRGSSSIATTAALSVAILIAVMGSYIGEKAQENRATAIDEVREPAQMQQYVAIDDADANGVPDWQDELKRTGFRISTSTATSTPNDPAVSIGTSLVRSLMSGYIALKQSESFTPERGETLAITLATNFKAPGTATLHSKAELTTDEGEGQTRILNYRSDMRQALAGLVDLEAEPEFSLYARFIQTNDTQWLEKLSQAAEKYRIAEDNLLAVAVPQSAADLHLRAVNAITVYAETLERLVRFSNDPLASMALLRTYNESEREFLLAFDALAKFYVEKTGN